MVMKATFIGVKDDVNITREDVLNENNCIYQFEIEGVKKNFCIKKKDDNYYIQNHLVPGVEYLIQVDGNTIMDIDFFYKNDVIGSINDFIPGKRTLKNFLKVLMAPLGKTIYVFGGGWSFQDDKASFIANTIGCFSAWENFYKMVDENYSYKDDTYPKNGWNRYFYAGLDCTGYLGWAIYNTLYAESEKEEGFVYPSSIVARTLADYYNFGTWKKPNTKDYKKIIKMLCPGDIVSINGHVYVVLGVCDDNSMLIIHSTVTESITGIKGGGVQINAISGNGDDDINCEAYHLAQEYMSKYYPEWIKRYPVTVKPVSIYLDFSGKEELGIFSWGGILLDLENVKNMTAREVLNIILGKR